MGTYILSNEQLIAAKNALDQCDGNKTKAANMLGLSRSTFRNRIIKYNIRNLDNHAPVHVPDGMEINSESSTYDKDGNLLSVSFKTRLSADRIHSVPNGHFIKGVSSLVDGQGNVVQEWIKTQHESQNLEQVIEVIKDCFKDYPAHNFKSKTHEVQYQNQLTLYPIPDLHLGLYAWGEETAQDWDLKIAIAAYEQAMLRVNGAAPPSHTAVVLGGGDLIHADNNDNVTAKSKNVLDVDTRYAKVFLKATELLVYQIELAKNQHTRVEVRILPGNHDEHSAIALTWFLHAWYRNDEQVFVDTDPSLFWWREFGKVLLGATHGHAAKLNTMPMVMATRQSTAWGRTEYRYVHGFHVHHKTQRIFEDGGVITESHQAPTVQDAYHFQNAYLSGRSLGSITYDIEFGEITRSKTVLK